MANENAIKILNQACEFAYMNCDRDKTPGVWDSLFAGKFFELTVKECSSVAIDNGCGDFVDIEKKLFEHFGIG